jgi:hypothetical protein
MAGGTWLIATVAALSLVVQSKAQSQSCTWIQFNNTLIYGGTANPASSLSDCQNACQTTTPVCQSIDWAPQNPPGSQCFVLNTQNNKVNATGVTHYDLSCSVASSSAATTLPGSPGGFSTSILSTQLSTALSSMTPSLTPGPPSTSLTPGPQTTLVGNVSGTVTPPQPGSAQRDCKTSYEISLDTSSINGRSVPEIPDLLTCYKACLELSDCLGFDFSQSTGCWIYRNATNFGQKFHQSGVVQYTFTRCPEEGIEKCNPIPIDVCDTSCFPTWARYVNTGGTGGQSFAPSYTNDYTGCLTACFNQSDCVGIDWTALPGSDAICTYYSTSQQSAMTSTSLKAFVTQYRLLNRCGKCERSQMCVFSKDHFYF